MSNRVGIPEPRPDLTSLVESVRALREQAQIGNGDKGADLDRYATLQDLVDFTLLQANLDESFSVNSLVVPESTTSVVVNATQDGSWAGFNPIANPPPTLGVLDIRGTTPSIDQRVFLGHFGLESTKGFDHTTFDRHKVALYAGVNATGDSGDVWAFNTVTTLDSTLTSDIDSYGYELDYNNLIDDKGLNYFSKARYGLGVTGAGTFLSTAAILVAGSIGSLGVDPIWHRGLLFAGPSCDSYDIETQSSATISYKVNGIHDYAMDTTDMAGNVLLMGNNQFQYAETAGAVATNILGINTSNDLLIGAGMPANSDVVLGSNDTDHRVLARTNIFQVDHSGATQAQVRMHNSEGSARITADGDQVFIQLNDNADWTSGSENVFSANLNGTATLYYNDGAMLSTLSSGIDLNNSAAAILVGTGAPEGSVIAEVSSLFLRTDGSSGTSLYVKEAGTGNTGWVGVSSTGSVDELVFSGNTAYETSSSGGIVKHPTSTSPRLALETSAGIEKGYIESTGSALRIISTDHGAPIRIKGEDNSGVEQEIFQADPDAQSIIYAAGAERIRARSTAQGGGMSIEDGPSITQGTGAPSASEPNGSIYLRTDGASSTTLYVRHGGSWSALS